MIITEKLKIKVNPANLKNLKQFMPDIKAFDIVEIPVSYLTNTSHIKVDVVCDVCGIRKNIAYRSYVSSISNGGYYSCSPKCSKQKGIKTSIERYGVDNPAKSDEIKDRIKNSFQEKYGVDNISFLPEIVDRIKTNVNKNYSENIDLIKEKQRNTNIEKYGVEDVNKEEWFKNKIKNINLEKYGVDNTFKLDFFKNKFKQSSLKKYGVDHPFKCESVKNKIQETNLKRYGVRYTLQAEEIKQKIKETNLRKYGCEYISQNPEIYESKILSGYRIKKHECGLNYQGTYEKDFIDICLEHNIKLSKPPSFLYEMFSKTKRYYPDFYIEKLNLIIEVKSKYYYEIHKDKNELKKQTITNNGFQYLMILDKNYEEFFKFIK